MTFSNYLDNIGLSKHHHILVHSSYKSIKNSFPEITGEKIIYNLKNAIEPTLGSLVMPAFTYCFKKNDGTHETFDRNSSKSKVGYLSELFRNSDDIVRTSSPTHSFSLWGKVTDEINFANNPASPLGKNSVMEWLCNKENSYILMLGVNFSSFTLGHYLEIITEVPWYNYSPWDFMGVEKVGVSIDGETHLSELPGCAKSFVNFEQHLVNTNAVQPIFHDRLRVLYVNVKILIEHGKQYFSNNYNKLLCNKGTCQACDSRRERFSI